MKIIKLFLSVIFGVSCYSITALGQTPKPLPPEIMKVVEEMPLFPGCENVSDIGERKKCADSKMFEFVYSNIKYPVTAIKNKVEGMVIVQFLVEIDGSITGAKAVRDIGANCGNEAVRIFNSMPRWNPGAQRGRPVKVQLNIPVRFKI